MTTMLVNGIEHLLVTYNDNTGYGLTMCEGMVGPWDTGPRLDEKITCAGCLKIMDDNAKVQSSERSKK
jgi:hypothetical protein